MGSSEIISKLVEFRANGARPIMPHASFRISLQLVAVHLELLSIFLDADALQAPLLLQQLGHMLAAQRVLPPVLHHSPTSGKCILLQKSNINPVPPKKTCWTSQPQDTLTQ
jgi:hypothetical protein